MQIRQNRRDFLASASLAAAAGTFGTRGALADDGAALETTRLRLVKIPSICQAPQYIAEALLRAEGFTDLQYIEKPGALAIQQMLASGEADINNLFAGPLITRIDAGDPIVVLAGLHIGCFELFGTERVRSIRDLKGKSVAVWELGSAQHVFLASMLAYVGVDPGKDIDWITRPPAEAKQMLAAGRVDAYLGFPPDPQELRAKQIGHVVVNSVLDRPWSQYFCCMLAGNRAFVRNHPNATKRAIRAILKANTICALEPERTARYLVDGAFTASYDYALQTMKDIPYMQWRDYSAEDTLRFYALRLHEVGMIKSSPNRIIAEGTDWRFVNELKRELRA
jgi:NitT/TauT family transport system substrate-binding protein